MAVPIKKVLSESEEKAVGRRRSTRVSLAIPIVLSGSDTSGNPFQENTRTIVVNNQGAKISTRQQMDVGSEVTIENSAMQMAGKAIVVWVSDRGEVGIQLLAAQNIWGIVFPPEDWETGPLIEAGGIKLDLDARPLETTPLGEVTLLPKPAPVLVIPTPIQSVPATAENPVPLMGRISTSPDHIAVAPPALATPLAPAKVELASPPISPESTYRPAPAGAPVSAIRTSSEQIRAATEAALQKLTIELDAAVDARLKAYAEKLIRFTGQFGLRVQANLQEAANRTEDRMVGLLQEKLSGEVDRVQRSQSELDHLNARFERLHQDTQVLVENTEQKIREEGQSAVQSAVQELTQHLRKEAETISTAVEAQSQERIQAKGSEAVHSILQKADKELSALVEEGLRKSASELRGRETEAVDAVGEQLNQIATVAGDAFHERLGRMTEELAPAARANMGKFLEESEEQFLKRVQEKGSEAAKLILEETGEHFTVLMEDGYRKSASELKAQQIQTVKGVKEQLDQVALASETSFHERLERMSREAGEQFIVTLEDGHRKSSSELEAQQTQAVKGVKDQIDQIAVISGASFQEQLERMAKDMAPSVRTELEQSLQAKVAALTTQTAQTLQEQAQFLTHEAVFSLQQVVQGLQERLQEESVKARHACEHETIKASESFGQLITPRSEAALSALNVLAEQVTAKLRAAQAEAETTLSTRVVNFQEQLAERSALALKSFETDLHNNARTLQDGAVRQLSQKLEGVADEGTESAAEKIRRRVQNELTDATETFGKESSQRLADLADEVFATSAPEFQARLSGQAKSRLDQVTQSAVAEFGESLKKSTRDAAASFEKQARIDLQKVENELMQASAENLRSEGEQVAASVQRVLQTSQAALDEHAQKQLVALSESTVDHLNLQAAAWQEEFRDRLSKSAEESREASLQELNARFQEALDKQRITISDLLQQQTEQSGVEAALQAKTVTEQAVAKATDAFDKQLGRGSRVLAELGDQARAGLENMIQKTEMEAKGSVENFQKQVDQSSSISIDKFRRETGTLVDEVISQLHQSAREFQGATAEELRAELQKTSTNLVNLSAAQMRKQTEETLELTTQQLKAIEKEVASEAADIFRSRIAEIFEILQPRPRKTE